MVRLEPGDEEAADELIFFVNGKKVTEKNADPKMTLLTYLRRKLGLPGTKLGCGEGGCGACTVMVSRFCPFQQKILHYSVNACLAPVCSLHLSSITTVEGIGSTKTRLHPIQERIAKSHGSQCGFCTPGIVMSLYALLRNTPQPSMEEIENAFQGNLCRCTGYRPILQGFRTFAKDGCCGKKATNGCCMESREENKGGCCGQKSTNGCCKETNGDNEGGCCGQKATNGCCKETNGDNEIMESTALFDPSEFQPLDPTQEPIFPPELLVRWGETSTSTVWQKIVKPWIKSNLV